MSGVLWQHLKIEKTSLERSSNLPKSDNWWSAESKLIPTSHGLKSSAMFYLHHATSWLLVWSQCQTLFGADCKLTDNSISAVSIFLMFQASKNLHKCLFNQSVTCVWGLLSIFLYYQDSLCLIRGWNFFEHIPLVCLWLPLPMALLIFTTVKFPQHISVVTLKDTFSPANDFVWAD